MSDEFIIKRKLLFNGQSFGEDQRLNDFLKKLARWANNSNTYSTECDKEYNNMLSQINYLKLYKKKNELTMHSNLKQLETYLAMQDDYEAKNKAALKDIQKQEKLLKEAQIMKHKRMNCSLMVKTINKGPSCKKLTERVNDLKQEVSNFEAEKKNLQMKINKLEKQGLLISISANALKLSLQDDKYFDQLN